MRPTKHLGDDGLARYTSTSDDDRIDEQLARAEGISLGMAGPVTARMIEEALTRFSPGIDDLVQLIKVFPHVTEPAARSVAKALLAFQHGDYEAAATMAMPRIETLVRALCDEKSVLRFRPQRDQRQGPSTRGQYPRARRAARTAPPVAGPLLVPVLVDASWSARSVPTCATSYCTGLPTRSCQLTPHSPSWPHCDSRWFRFLTRPESRRDERRPPNSTRTRGVRRAIGTPH